MSPNRVISEGGSRVCGNTAPPHVLPRLFESLFTTKRAEKGTGLGLSLSRERVEQFVQAQSSCFVHPVVAGQSKPKSPSIPLTEKASSVTDLMMGQLPNVPLRSWASSTASAYKTESAVIWSEGPTEREKDSPSERRLGAGG